jgi:hypothetical protein
MPEEKTYEGGCHCGKVRYKVASDLTPVIECNCSICSKKGTLLTFVGEPAFELLSGKDALSEYQFNKHVIHHLFCSTCGVTSFSRGKKPDGTAMVAINVRCLDGVDLRSLQITPFDGKSK